MAKYKANQEQLKQLTEQLEQGVRDVFESDKYKCYLHTMSKLHTYSYRNMLLISMQCPDASMVAGAAAWRKDFERYPKKGTKAIKIIAPCPRTVDKEVDKIDPVTQTVMIDANGKPIKERIRKIIPAYRVVNVFDVSQTAGKEIKGLDLVKDLTGDVPGYKDMITALRYAAPVGIRFDHIEGTAKGYYDAGEKRIVIKQGMSQAQTAKTIIHEIAHGKLHDTDFGTQSDKKLDRNTKEVQAESVAYVVAQHYGLDTSDYSFGYIASWSKGKDLDELEDSLEAIRNTADEIIQAVDKRLIELEKERNHALEENTQTKRDRPVLLYIQSDNNQEKIAVCDKQHVRAR